MRYSCLSIALLLPLSSSAQTHPLDALTTAEYWAVYDILKFAGHVTPETNFASVLLRPPAKAYVLGWKEGQPLQRAADVVLLRGGKSFASHVDIAARKVVRFDELQNAQAPFLRSELGGSGEFVKKDERIVKALARRGITDLRTVECLALPVAYRAIPEQATQRTGFGGCSMKHGVYHTWGRAIEGLTFQADMVEKKVIRVDDTELVPVPTGDVDYEETAESPRPHTTPISTAQPAGPGYRIDKGEVSWQNWLFRFRIDPRTGVILNLVRIVDKGRPRSILYEAGVSELFVPYMDTAPGWNNRAFIDAGQFFAASGFLKPLKPGLDCPAHASYFNGLSATEDGMPHLSENMACLFERHPESAAWRHGQEGTTFGRPNRQLVLRSAAVIGNYDYILDWRFEPDGSIEAAVGATGVIETRSVTQKLAPDHGANAGPETGQHVAANTLGVNHDHFFSFRLDLDVDGAANNFMVHRMVPKSVANDPMRKSIWVSQASTPQREQDAMMDIHLDRPSMWMFVNPAVKTGLNHNPGYEVMPGATAKSLMTADDPTQVLGAFCAHQFWVTPYNEGERYASGTYPTSSDGKDGLAVWTQANRPIVNTDIVGWYTMGFHHIPRAEDWPVMPVKWHHFHIRPFHFFERNPVLDLPRSVTALPAR